MAPHGPSDVSNIPCVTVFMKPSTKSSDVCKEALIDETSSFRDIPGPHHAL